MKGNLKDFNPTQILNLVSLARKTGTLVVNRKGVRTNLSFKEGKLVFAAMGEADGSLTKVLASAGRINKEQAGALAKHAEKTGDKQLGLLLIQKGFVSRTDIVQCIKRHALNVVQEFAAWKEGAFDFENNHAPGDDKIIVPLDLENIIVQIARVQKRDEQLEEEIPSLDVALKFTAKSRDIIQGLQLSREEWEVLKFVKSGNTILMIGKSMKLDDKQVRRIVGSLREAGLVELAQVRQREVLNEDEKEKKRALLGRLINHIQGIGG